MKHSEMHTWTLQYCTEKIGCEEYLALHTEIKLFKEHFPNAIINADRMGYIAISYASRNMAHGAAEAFQNAVERHKWWKEL